MDELRTMVMYQVGALEAFCKAQGLKLQHVKPHGAMYNMAGKDEAMAEAICAAIYAVDPSLILLGASGSKMLEAAKAVGLKGASEVFADRAYEEDGSLVARTKPGAMITDEDEAVSRVITMVRDRKIKTVTGKEIEVKADSICLHGDSAKAVLFAQEIKKAIEESGIQIAPLREVVS